MRFCLVSDDDGHSYVIPSQLREAWYAWLSASDGYDDPPDYAARVEGRLTFSDPVIG